MNIPKLFLIILDGWGYSPIHKGNAIWNAKTPTYDYLWKTYSHTLLNAFGANVGLPWGAIGSSEVGHTSIGTGILIHQELSLVDKEIADGNFYKNKDLIEFTSSVNPKTNDIHIIGLVSDGGVHSHMTHIYAILKFLKEDKFGGNIFIHVITDGRDVSPQSSVQYIKELEKEIKSIYSKAMISTISGRYYAMDRDSRWDRTKKAYEVMTGKSSEYFDDPESLIKSNYSNKILDEFIKPGAIRLKRDKKNFLGIFEKEEKPITDGFVKPNDGVIFFNIRPDRMRQIVEMFIFKKKEIETNPVKGAKILTLTTYDELLPAKILYPSKKFENPLAKIFSEKGFKQGHFAETEKYAHVTYFFNGGNPSPYKNETWKLVPSPNVATYDLKPEMSADDITKAVFENITKEKLDFVLINYANSDMVGHTGDFNKVISAVEAVDRQLKKIIDKYEGKSIILITADHGNAECMIHPETGEVDKKHTVNPVPFIIIDKDFKLKRPINDESIQPSGILADIAPTILDLLDFDKVSTMTGVSLKQSLKEN